MDKQMSSLSLPEWGSIVSSTDTTLTSLTILNVDWSAVAPLLIQLCVNVVST